MTIVTVYIGDTPIELEGEFYPGEPAQLFGLPEDCAPGESATFEAEAATIAGVDVWDMLYGMHDLISKPGEPAQYSRTLARLEEEACVKLLEEGYDDYEPEIYNDADD